MVKLMQQVLSQSGQLLVTSSITLDYFKWRVTATSNGDWLRVAEDPENNTQTAVIVQ